MRHPCNNSESEEPLELTLSSFVCSDFLGFRWAFQNVKVFCVLVGCPFPACELGLYSFHTRAAKRECQLFAARGHGSQILDENAAGVVSTGSIAREKLLASRFQFWVSTI